MFQTRKRAREVGGQQSYPYLEAIQGRYREVTSCSNTTDYQARRLGIRYRGERGLQPPHTLNGTVVTDRALLAVLENFQGDVPDVLAPYGAPASVGPA